MSYKSLAKANRKNMTQEEKHLWYDFLRSCPIPFTRQRRIENYIVDFYCHQARLVIEIDGSQHYTEAGQSYDQNRTALLEQLGILVIRYTNFQVMDHFDVVVQEIARIIYERTGKNVFE